MTGGVDPLVRHLSVFQFPGRPRFLMFDRQRSVVGRHFPVMLARNRIWRPLGALFKHPGTFDKVLSTGHWHRPAG